MRLLFLITNFISIALLCITSVLFDSLKSSNERIEHVHKTLLLDRQFTEKEVELITMAAMEWTEATRHIVEIDVIQLPNEDEMLTPNSVIVNSVSPDSANVLIMEATTQHMTLGLHTIQEGVDVIEIVSSRIPENQYKEVVLHELGHVLGLGHIHGLEGFNTLMSPYIEFGADHITAMDLHYFCKKYRCPTSHY